MMGCSPGWGCEAVINHQNKAFDLAKTVDVSHGNYSAMMADTIARFKEGKPVIYYTWTPYWVSDVLKPGKDVVWLQVPFSSLPGEQKELWLPGEHHAYCGEQSLGREKPGGGEAVLGDETAAGRH